MEIVRANPMSKGQGHHARMGEFKTRYERLEAAVPTPDDETVDVRDR